MLLPKSVISIHKKYEKQFTIVKITQGEEIIITKTVIYSVLTSHPLVPGAPEAPEGAMFQQAQNTLSQQYKSFRSE